MLLLKDITLSFIYPTETCLVKPVNTGKIQTGSETASLPVSMKSAIIPFFLDLLSIFD